MISFRYPGRVRIVATLLAILSLFVWPARAQSELDRGDFYEIGARAGPGVVRPWLVPTPSGFLAGWNADGRVVLRALDDNGRPRASETVLGLPFVAGLVPVRDGALVIGPDRLIAVDGLGRQLAPARRLERPPVGIHHGFAHGSAGLLMIALARGEDGARLTSALFDPANGRRLQGPFAIDVADAFVVALGVALLPGGGALTAWSEGREIRVLRLDARGAPESEAHTVHRVRAGGALQCCWLATEGEAVRLVWRDSADGDFVLRGVVVDIDGSPGAVAAVSDGRGDALHPSVATHSEGTMVAWVSGVRFGLFARTGRGVLALRRADGRGAVKRLAAPGNIERAALAADSGRLAAVVLWREAEGARAARLAARGFILLE